MYVDGPIPGIRQAFEQWVKAVHLDPRNDAVVVYNCIYSPERSVHYIDPTVGALTPEAQARVMAAVERSQYKLRCDDAYDYAMEIIDG